jgi:ABC-type nitrate/sulfonate/bicarbonate transport system substrate-binding protein
MRKQRIACAALIGVLAFAGGATTLTLSAPLARGETLQHATLANPSVSLSMAASYLAEDLGFFRQNGLDVNLIVINGLGAINAVISGSAEFSESSGPSLTRAAAKGQRLLAIAQLADRPTIQLVLRKEVAEAAHFDPAAPLAIRAQALKGRTVAVDAVNSINHAFVKLLAKRGGFDESQMSIAILPAPSALAAFESGSIDGFASGAPWPQQTLLEGKAVMIASGPDGDPPDAVPFASLVLVARPDTCATGDLCAKMGRSIAAAVSFLHTHPDEALAALQKRLPTFTPALLKSSFEVVRRTSPDPPAPTLKALENCEIFSVEAGLLAPEDRLKDYDGLFTDRYVK